ncbi:hypothetical protein A3D77_03235 [Candidatus Gottesmanbacteria bacterium RIFCSPHIGHO2_02_FULL_39_11]|uniref:Soluble ligand binding domain-containing protein n=1 Tax=Candidatus Gottesmanbacteria bacterium RIFCSPHIGHO2_02_FULL_39_11 TaxID=1798382 RepID=A0A1F5ZNQ5_9BACT|nr:MAG: hypothetical protein A3D77_03235 [Candidatus Gottesmanbacteria bacterium RIFCSPHIGHO2_02_FULL_39_11]
MTASKEDISFLFEDKKPALPNFPLKHLISEYKWVIIPGFLGLSFLVLAFLTIIVLPRENHDVVFTNSASASAEISIHVDVEGQVENPGLYSLKNGDRVEEALVAAGGFSANADRIWVAKRLNRAKILTDGDKIYVPSVEEINNSQQETNNKEQITNGGEDVLDSESDLVDINIASSAQLDTLPGVGEVTANKIISGRPYDKIEDLLNRKIIGKSLFEKIKNLITAE